jgi:hypothetical protein
MIMGQLHIAPALLTAVVHSLKGMQPWQVSKWPSREWPYGLPPAAGWQLFTANSCRLPVLMFGQAQSVSTGQTCGRTPKNPMQPTCSQGTLPQQCKPYNTHHQRHTQHPTSDMSRNTHTHRQTLGCTNCTRETMTNQTTQNIVACTSIGAMAVVWRCCMTVAGARSMQQPHALMQPWAMALCSTGACTPVQGQTSAASSVCTRQHCIHTA